MFSRAGVKEVDSFAVELDEYTPDGQGIGNGIWGRYVVGYMTRKPVVVARLVKWMATAGEESAGLSERP